MRSDRIVLRSVNPGKGKPCRHPIDIRMSQGRVQGFLLVGLTFVSLTHGTDRAILVCRDESGAEIVIEIPWWI